MAFEVGVDTPADEDEPPVVVDVDVEVLLGAEEPLVVVGADVAVVPVDAGVPPAPVALLVDGAAPGKRAPRIQVFSAR